MRNCTIFLLFICSLLVSEPKEHQSLMATLFVQNSAESYTNSLSIYRAAEDQLEKVVKNTNVSAAIEQTKGFAGKPPAVILDIDQTVLDNIAYQARLIETNTYYPEGWKEWCEEEQADYMPGVESFLKKASDLGVEVFFITNRDVNVEVATKNNLEKSLIEKFLRIALFFIKKPSDLELIKFIFLYSEGEKKFGRKIFLKLSQII